MLLILTHVILAFASAGAWAFSPASTCGTDELARKALETVKRRACLEAPPSPRRYPPIDPRRGAGAHTAPSHCTFATASVRKEWDSLLPRQKRAYIGAVQCLLGKPSISRHLAPGALNRYDDFVATHINQTRFIHGTGSFLSWHRYFTWTYEQALRTECGYREPLPYLNWGRYALDLLNAPVFDGSDTSMSGNGVWDPRNNGSSIPNNALPQIIIPPGRGGGCVETGPFAHMTVHLGSVTPSLSYIPKNPRNDSLGCNPRCLRRDISAYAAQTWSRDENTTALITESPHIGAFQTTLQGDFPAGFLGAHTAGHFFVGGDPGGDLFASPGDPFFHLNHAQVDRIWWIWQHYQDVHGTGDRLGEIANATAFGSTRNATLDDEINLGLNAPAIRIRDAVDTLSGPFCYYYD